MATIPFAQLDFRFGFVLAQSFTNQGAFDSWAGPFQRAEVTFSPPFPSDDVRVFLTPTNESLAATEHHAAVVGVAHRISRNGFELQARSTDCAIGSSSFNWLAVSGAPLNPLQAGPPHVEFRMARVQRLSKEPTYQSLSTDCTEGDTAVWPSIPFSRPFANAAGGPLSPIVFVTQYDEPDTFNRPCVGMLRSSNAQRFGLAARNFDSIGLGFPRYGYVALARTTDQQTLSKVADLRVAFGDVRFTLDTGGQFGDFHDAPVYFDSPFRAPPIVLMTARTATGQPFEDLRAFHAVAASVEEYSFTAMARSADDQPGSMLMSWIAFGCGEMCGG